MPAVELIAAAIEAVLGNVEGITLAIGLGFAAHYLGKATILGYVMKHLQASLLILAGLVVLGVADLNPGVAVSLAGAAVDLFLGVLPL